MIIGNSLVNEECGFVLWWHAKAGCTSLKAWYLETMGEPVPDELRSPIISQDLSVHQACDDMPRYEAEKHAKLIHFTVVRNPFSRLVSHFRQQVSAGPLGLLDIDKTLQQQRYDSFRQFVGVVCGTPEHRMESHIMPYSRVLRGVCLHAILPLEKIDDGCGWLALMRALELPQKYLAWRMRTPHTDDTAFCGDWPSERFREDYSRPAWPCYYDDTLRQQVKEKYHDDFERFYPTGD